MIHHRSSGQLGGCDGCTVDVFRFDEDRVGSAESVLVTARHAQNGNLAAVIVDDARAIDCDGW